MDYKYQKVYDKVVSDIEKGMLVQGQKIPSIRQMTQLLEVSKTTVESAYDQLCVEGYVEARKKVGYFVASEKTPQLLSAIVSNIAEVKNDYRYDFSGQFVDEGSFNMEVWKKYIKKALLENKKLHSYGKPFGEHELLSMLQNHSQMFRGFKKDINNYIVGAGFQTLLHSICAMFLPGSTIVMDETPFIQAQIVFEDSQLNVKKVPSDEFGISIEQLKKHSPQIIYINSSSGGYHGQPIQRQRRNELIQYAREYDVFIIEDDHNGELKYNSKTIDAMAGDDDNHIIYIGSFSKLLLPSIRLSYMVLPQSLVDKYKERNKVYHQTASKLEQIALAMYMQDGQLARHIKRLRKLYIQKASILVSTLTNTFPKFQFRLYETSLKVVMIVFDKDVDLMISEALKYDVLLLKNNSNEIVYSFSSIALSDIETAVIALKKAWKSL